MVTFTDSARFHSAVPMPGPVREAREAALGLAGFGILYPAALGLTLGSEAAVTAALHFAPSLLIGLLALGFRSGDASLRKSVLVLAAVQILLGLHIIGATDLGVIVVLTVLYVWGTSAMLIYLLRRPQAVAWFTDDGQG
ncbi:MULTISPECIES: hypothetical protein [Nocardia]|uniref:hypothetical protein n=1 Tax=Nocardia TaxID=1817 RepID=UPI0013007874|nr:MULTISPECIES: hypothetical protein [Nocardia]